MDTIVLHATAHAQGATFEGVIRYLQRSAATANPVSYHYLIAADGRIVKGCPAASCAYHAGRSRGPQGPNVNEYSVGIAFFNRNDGLDPYPAAQKESCRRLILELKRQFPAMRYVTTHYGVSWGRKTDPRGFNVLELARQVSLVPWKAPEARWL
ncbi:MAG TPA: peptidoglycan recognition family protein [Fimbriimonadaceae bacterium]|nr:peptidoglycan recognition family protein [Fimbriimonadaceae bacterium]